MNKFGNCPLCGKQVKPTTSAKSHGRISCTAFAWLWMASPATWGALIQNLRCDADLTDEQVQKIILHW